MGYRIRMLSKGICIFVFLSVIHQVSFGADSNAFINMFEEGKIQHNNYYDAKKLDAKRAALRDQLKKDRAHFKVNRSIAHGKEVNEDGLDSNEQRIKQQNTYSSTKEYAASEKVHVVVVRNTKNVAPEATAELSKWFVNNNKKMKEKFGQERNDSENPEENASSDQQNTTTNETTEEASIPHTAEDLLN